MTARPILYSFRRCPYAMRARMAIAVSGVETELREVVLSDKPGELLAISPKATVPVVLQTNGQVLEESLDIMRWALDQNDPENWLGGYDPELIAANDGPFKHALDRYKYPHRYGLEDGTAYRESGLEHLTNLDTMLAKQDYLSGARRGFTDIALFPFVRQFAATDQPWFESTALSSLKRWLAQLVESELFANIMGRYPQWTPGDAITVFPARV